jgi:GNAT superfamily N-acetyltransferase
VALYELDASTAIVKKLYVRPAFRKLGLARSMLLLLLERARESGYIRIVLDTQRERLAAAYRLYCDIGFTECEPYGEVDYASPTFMELLFE